MEIEECSSPIYAANFIDILNYNSYEIIAYEAKWSVDRLIAEEINNDIIQTGINKDINDKTIWQWNFKNITEKSFGWESIYSKDNGESWEYATRLEAKRVVSNL